MSEKKICIFGGRDFQNYALMEHEWRKAVESYPQFTLSIVSGMARGADRLALKLAKDHAIKLYEFPADWDTYPRQAGYLRNTQMAEFSDAGIAFWDGRSRGTLHNIREHERLGKPVVIIHY